MEKKESVTSLEFSFDHWLCEILKYSQCKESELLTEIVQVSITNTTLEKTIQKCNTQCAGNAVWSTYICLIPPVLGNVIAPGSSILAISMIPMNIMNIISTKLFKNRARDYKAFTKNTILMPIAVSTPTVPSTLRK